MYNKCILILGGSTMYTKSIEDEMEFLVTLSKSSESLKLGEHSEVTKCPKCDKGTIMTHYKTTSPKPTFHHYCNSCGEIFDVSKLKAELFFNAQSWTLKELSTPLGNIHISVNGSNIYFRYLVSIYKDSRQNVPFLVSKIELDVSKLKPNDLIHCSFPQQNFKQDTLSNMLICWYEDDSFLLAICSHLESMKQNNFHILPSGMDFTLGENLGSNLVLAVVCLDKKLHKDVSISELICICDIWQNK